MDALLCTLSPKRLALIEDEPDVLKDLVDARNDEDAEIPGLLSLGTTWHALDLVLGTDEPLGDAIVARSGAKLKAAAAIGQARVLPAARVAAIAKALAALPATAVPDRYATLLGKQVHGNFGQEAVGADDKPWLRERVTKNRATEIDTLTRTLAAVIALYKQAAASGHSMMSVLVQ